MKFKTGNLYKITFWDHCVGELEPIKFDVVGWVVRDHPDFIVTTHWAIDKNCEDMDLIENSIEPSTVLKSTIISWEKL